MTNPEAGLPLEQPEIMPEQHRTLRERFFGEGRDEDGFLQIAAGKMIAAGLAGSIVVGGAVVHEIFSGVEKEKTIVSKGGQLKSVFVMEEKECHGGYIATVNAKSELNIKKKIPFTNIKVPTTLRASEEFTGDVTNEVCNTGVDGERVTDLDTGKIHITIPAEAFTTTVYETNPADAKAWKSDNGFGAAMMKNIGNLVKVLPGGVDAKGGDQLQAKLRGEAKTAAYEVSAKSCGVKAWDILRQPYAEEIKESVVRENNQAIGAKQITEADVTVDLPEKIEFDTQYTKQFEDMQIAAKKHGVNFTLQDPAKVRCRANPNIKVTDKSTNPGSN